MAIDYQATLLDPIYATLGVPASVILADATRVEGLTVIDKTSGVQLGDKESKVDSIEPAACIRRAEWSAKGYRPIDFEKASIEFNGSRWKIKAYPKRPVPSGVKTGEVLLILGNETELDSSQ